MKSTKTIIIGAGQAGLALSRCLQGFGLDHVVLERGQAAQSWTERWDSLRLLSPNWMTRLPGFRYSGGAPDGYMGRDEVITYLQRYAASFGAPVLEETPVRRVRPADGGFIVDAGGGTWRAANVVIATGHCQETRIPGMAAFLSRRVEQVPASRYRRPGQLPEGGVLVVGASATGVQLADELLRSGREVTIATGRHTRLPRRYRGKDILYWLDWTGALRRPLSDLPDRRAAASEPSLQLVGDEAGRNVDLAALSHRGVRLAGRLTSIDGVLARFADDLPSNAASADLQMGRLLERIDRQIEAHGLGGRFPAGGGWEPTPRVATPREIDLEKAGIRCVLWATGYRRSYPWLDAGVLDDRGEVVNERGVTPVPGLFVLGLQFMIRRNSSLIDGVGEDAMEIATAIRNRAGWRRREAA
ncbi:MAG: NAD(P)-binding domain-containing protein [Thermoanaerobaculia bacterium]|nr:NAD(P)-binding domain-containing protein [Thermoanaerobaculia bacterium]